MINSLNYTKEILSLSSITSTLCALNPIDDKSIFILISYEKYLHLINYQNYNLI